MNKTVRNVIVGVVITIFFVSAVIITYYVTVMRSTDNAVAIIVESGNEAMNGQHYTKAIEKYIEALEYEPENKDLKDAIAHAYVMYAGTLANGPEAVEAYQNALSYNKTNTNAYWGMAGIYENNGDEDSVLMTLQTGFINTGDTNMKIKADNIEIERARIQAELEAEAAEAEKQRLLEEAHNDKLSKLIVLFQTDKINYDDIKTMIRTEEFVEMADEVIGANNCFYYGDRDENGKRSGKGLAIYSDGYYYYGDYADDMRSGNGIIIRAVYAESSAIGSFIFEGEFANDMPNGKGSATSNFYKDKISAAELTKQVITGQYTDGKENGTMNLSGLTKAGKTVKYTYKAENGIAVKSSNDDSGIKGQYIIAKSADEKSILSSDGSVRGVEGFIGE